jgi:hypothetical protein
MAVDAMGGRWQMLTVTLRHRPGMRLKELLAGLSAAWRRTRQGGRIQRVWSERVSASVRALEMTYGGNGWHPHIHVLLRTTEWDDDERDALLAGWKRAIERELGAAVRPDDEHGLVWSAPFDASAPDKANRARYLAKLGLETTGLAKEGRGGSLTPWQIAAIATKGDDAAKSLWWEYVDATRGRRMIELDDRAQEAYERALLEQRSEGGDVDDLQPPIRIDLKRDDLRALRRLERTMPTIMAIVLAAAESGGRRAVGEWIAYARADAAARDEAARDRRWALRDQSGRGRVESGMCGGSGFA